MTEQMMLQRTKQFAIRATRLATSVQGDIAGQVFARQLIRSATSVGANYRAACRARSSAEWIAKLGVVEEEADESGYWMELIVETGLLSRQSVHDLLDESRQLTAMMAASKKTSRRNNGVETGNRKSQIENRKSP